MRAWVKNRPRGEKRGRVGCGQGNLFPVLPPPSSFFIPPLSIIASHFTSSRPIRTPKIQPSWPNRLGQWSFELSLAGPKRDISSGKVRPILPARVANHKTQDSFHLARSQIQSYHMPNNHQVLFLFAFWGLRRCRLTSKTFNFNFFSQEPWLLLYCTIRNLVYHCIRTCSW